MTTPATRGRLRVESSKRPSSTHDGGIPETTHRTRRGIGNTVADLGLWILAALGGICILLVVLALTANVTLIMFRTGSMSPAIPAGAVAVVQELPASEIHVGDVTTVDRAGELPITHRVTSVEPGETGSQRVITMRGDANAQDDPAPYSVDTVRIVRFSVPGLAPVIVAMSSPVVLGGVTVSAAVLVFWVFWPRRSRARDESDPNGETT